jgi:hypothetical protein
MSPTYSPKWLTWGVGIATLLILSTIFLIPLNSDSDIYQAMAVDLWKYGKLPYVGSWDHNFPGIVYLHWIPLVLFGNSDLSFRLLDLASNCIAAYFLYALSRKLVDSDVALLAPIMYSIYYVSGGWWAIGQRDVFAGCFLLGAAWIYTRSLDALTRNSLLIGLLVGCAAFIRPTYALILPLVALRPFSVRRSLLLALGFASPFILFIAFFSLSGGATSEVILAVITYNTQAYGGLAEPWTEFIARSPFQILIACLACLGLIIALRRRTSLRVNWTIISGVLTGLVSVVMMRKFFVYHFHVLFTFLIVLAVAGVGLLLERTSKPSIRLAIIFSSTALLLVAFYPRHLIGIAARAGGSIGERLMHTQAAFSMDSSFGRTVDLQLADYLGAEKNVELVSVTPAVQWMNELDRPSRFTMVHCLTTIGQSGRLTSFQERWRDEYLSALEKRKPKIIALADGPRFLMKYIRGTPKDLALEIRGRNGHLGFAQLLGEQYVLDTTIGGYYIYTRNVP